MNKLTFEDGYNQAYQDFKKNPDVDKLLYDYALGLTGFWFHNPKARPRYDIYGNEIKTNDYKVIVTKYDKGYRKALDEIIDSIKNGFMSALNSGIRYGYPCTDVGVKVTAIGYNELTSSTFAFEACAAQVFDKACTAANPVILEPVMNVDISCPKEFVGPASSQLSQRGGNIMGQDSKTTGEIIHAQAPMANMFGFTTNLRSATQGRASFSMEFSHFQLKVGGLG